MPPPPMGGKLGFGYAILALVVGIVFAIGIFYVPQYINYQFTRQNLPPILPIIPPDAPQIWIAFGISFIVMFFLLTMGRKTTGSQPVQQR